MNIIVVTNPYNGRDCVVGVFADAEALRNSWIFEEEDNQRGPKGILNLKKALIGMDLIMHSKKLVTSEVET